MKIAVAIKQVPERTAQVRIAASGKWICEDDLQFMLNEPDAYALEHALLLREKHGGEVVVVSAGPQRVAPALREALAKGADRAIHIVCENFAAYDAWGIANLLAAAICPEAPDLFLAGLQSEDFGFGQTGVIVAELLNLPHASLILHAEVTGASLTVQRELENGWFQTVELPLPAALTIQSGGVRLRYTTLMGIKQARTKQVRVLAASDLAATLEPTILLDRVELPHKQKTTQILTGTASQAAASLVAKLRSEARVL